ncbi:hypothetical protein [Croceibacterium aestuarii]|uniref:hypothetical protein n=1 Tax=Croceibacterium aestuarii TaxID=3064139 RepID=UPI00272DE9BA|nr:hypothetical protein [Croceibacterium sp. D39]
MPERQSRHPDNELIDEMQEQSLGGAQQSRSGGEVNRRVGTRADLKRAEGKLTGDEVETAVGSDNPEQDARKGDKTFEKIRNGKQNG